MKSINQSISQSTNQSINQTVIISTARYQRSIFATQELQCNTLLEFKDKKYQPLQTLIGDLERALPAACEISETKQDILNVRLFH